MAQQRKFYNVEEAAEVLGVTMADVNGRRERHELRAFRDGATWKFKVEDIDALAEELRLAAEQGDGSAEEEPQEDGDVLLSDIALDDSPDEAPSKAAGGRAAGGKVKDDVELVDDDPVSAGDSDLSLATDDEAPQENDVTSDLDLTLDEDVSLGGSHISLEGDSGHRAFQDGESTLDFSDGPGKKKRKSEDDSDLVLGGSESRGDVGIGGDSGISLVDPVDSGLSLEEPLELSQRDGEDSLTLGEDDMLMLGGDAPADAESPTLLKTDDDFLLQPMDQGTDDEESESGSQVIALDADPAAGSSAATMMAVQQQSAMGNSPSMLGEDFEGMDSSPTMAGTMESMDAMGTPMAAAGAGFAGAVSGVGLGDGFASAGSGAVVAGGPLEVPVEVGLPETPYSILNVLSLAACVLVLILCGIMVFDVVRNMWSWNGAYAVNSSLMDYVLGMFEK